MQTTLKTPPLRQKKQCSHLFFNDVFTRYPLALEGIDSCINGSCIVMVGFIKFNNLVFCDVLKSLKYIILCLFGKMGIKFSLSSIRKVAPSHAKPSAEDTLIVTAANIVNDLGSDNQLDSEEQHILTSCALTISSDSYSKAIAVDKEVPTSTSEQPLSRQEEQSLTEGILPDEARPSSQNEDDQCFIQVNKISNQPCKSHSWL